MEVQILAPNEDFNLRKNLIQRDVENFKLNGNNVVSILENLENDSFQFQFEVNFEVLKIQVDYPQNFPAQPFQIKFIQNRPKLYISCIGITIHKDEPINCYLFKKWSQTIFTIQEIINLLQPRIVDFLACPAHDIILDEDLERFPPLNPTLKFVDTLCMGVEMENVQNLFSGSTIPSFNEAACQNLDSVSETFGAVFGKSTLESQKLKSFFVSYYNDKRVIQQYILAKYQVLCVELCEDFTFQKPIQHNDNLIINCDFEFAETIVHLVLMFPFEFPLLPIHVYIAKDCVHLFKDCPIVSPKDGLIIRNYTLISANINTCKMLNQIKNELVNFLLYNPSRKFLKSIS